METHFTSDWFSPHIPTWETFLGELKGKADLHFLEIGTYEGRSACWLLENILTHESSRITCIDLFEVGEEILDIFGAFNVHISPTYNINAAFDMNIRAIHAENKVIKLQGRSRDMLHTLPLQSFDCAYIDGSHTSASALADSILAWDLLKPNGILIFDDYEWEGFPNSPLKNPKIGIDAFLMCFADEYEMLHKNYQVFIKKNPQVKMF